MIPCRQQQGLLRNPANHVPVHIPYAQLLQQTPHRGLTSLVLRLRPHSPLESHNVARTGLISLHGGSAASATPQRWARWLHRRGCCPAVSGPRRTRGCLTATQASRQDLPQDWTQVASWARSQFLRATAPELPDTSIHLAKACLLVALEEEAGRSSDALHPELRELVRGMKHLRPRSAASASTWSLERLDSLAAEVAALLEQQRQEMEAGPHPVPTPTPHADPLSHSLAPGAVGGEGALPSGLEPSAPLVAAAEATAVPQLDPHVGTEEAHVATASAAPTRPDGQREGQQQQEVPAHALAHRPQAADVHGGEAPAGAGTAPRPSPVELLTAVNTVLFDRHGYQPCNRYGVASDHQLTSVMEAGVGASAALSILYLEVCARLGFPMAARPLEDGRYFVLWPLQAALLAGGQRFLVDPYGRGGLLLMEEVCEIFGVSESDLQPAPRRELLAALLGELRDAHWAAAVGCGGSPATMVPLSVETALANKVAVPRGGVGAAALARALAAAERRQWLLPHNSEAQLQLGLLHYFSRRYDDAWIELALYLERFVSPQQQQQQDHVQQLRPLPHQLLAATPGEEPMPPMQAGPEGGSEPLPPADDGASVAAGPGAVAAAEEIDAISANGDVPCAAEALAPTAGEVPLQQAAGVQPQAAGHPAATESGASGAGPLAGAVPDAKAERVRVLLEKIRLELDFAGSGRAGWR